MSKEEAEVSYGLLISDIRSAKIRHHYLSPAHFTLAGQFLHKYSYTRSLRALDALQLAVGVTLSREGLADVFVTADKLLAEIARSEGLSILIPAA